MARGKRRDGRQHHDGPWIDREHSREGFWIFWYDPAKRRVKRRRVSECDRRCSDQRGLDPQRCACATEALGRLLIELSTPATDAAPAPVLDPAQYPIAAALALYGQLRSPGHQDAERDGYAIKAMLGFFGETMAGQITPGLIKAYADRRKAEGVQARKKDADGQWIKGKWRPIASGTIRRELAVLQTALHDAVLEGKIRYAPEFALPEAGPGRTRALTEDEIEKLLAVSPPHLRLWLLLAINTAGRKTAILKLRWAEQIDFVDRLVRLRPPGEAETSKRKATVPMSDALYEELLRARAAAEQPDDRPGRESKLPPEVITYRGEPVLNIRKSFATACRRAGIVDRVTPHVTKHTAGTLLAKAGVPLGKVALILGHSEAKTTELYQHLQPGWLRDEINVLGRATTSRRRPA